ncbi:metallophosphoesterase [Silvibacterium acidisoli]|uniref:metallophosphoesterase n=1 Tax=Acidobacteriaceae bacterium ZG23-2 TaxID=2883246 RepID=UPI00406BEB0A
MTASERRKTFSRRRFLQLSGAAAVGLPLYAGEIARHELRVEDRTFHLARLPDVFRGIRIVQVSDFHYKEFTEAFFLREVVREINRLRPDAVVFTGDFITNGYWSAEKTVGFGYECAEILSHVECPLRFGVLGNHDAVVRPEAMIDALVTHGITALENSAFPIERDGKRLWIAGSGDALTGHFRPEHALPRATQAEGEPVVFLVHEPDVLPEVLKWKVDLMLSGHTHGGQVRLPFVPPMFLPSMGQVYVEGVYQMGATQLYVNRGIGTVNLPFRLNCPPEITHITLA